VKATRIVIFAKAPVSGLAKTRLIPALGADQAARLARRMLLRTLREAQAAAVGPVELCVTPGPSDPAWADWPPRAGIAWSEQSEGDLGARMADAFGRAFVDGFRRVLLVGSDLPDLPGALFETAFAALGHHHAVIGPTLDGGYYLIGFRPQTFLPAVFQTIPWGTTRVLAETLAVFRRHGLSVHQLPVWRDIDDLDDLIAFARRPFGAAAPARRTREVLAGLDLEGRKVPPVT